MSTRRVKSLLWLLSALFLCGAIVAGVYGIGLSPPLLKSARTAQLQGNLASTRPAYDLKLDDFQPLWDLQLRQPLFDPPPTPPPPPPVVKAPILTIKLAGIINEPGHSVAMFTMPDGQIEMKAVGERCGEAEVISIEENAVGVRFNGQTIKLKLQEG